MTVLEHEGLVPQGDTGALFSTLVLGPSGSHPRRLQD